MASALRILTRILSYTLLLLLGLGLLAALAAGVWAVYEMRTSRFQAKWISERVDRFSTRLADGTSDSIAFPSPGGPEDERRGYAHLPEFRKALEGQGFEVVRQARWSPALLEHKARGYFTPYREKDQAGLRLRDRKGDSLFQVLYPFQGYQRFSDLPPVLVRTLLFIEDRQLLDTARPFLNPAVDWSRFTRALYEQGKRQLGLPHESAGGSTLATQIEKYRHSPEGRTAEPRDKLRQMISASFRAYLDGPYTWEARQEIVRRYFNSVPLAALPGYGEVNGLGDGLTAWYDADFESVNALLHLPVPPAGDSGSPAEELGREQALAYRQALQLFVAHRRPSDLLRGDAAKLGGMVDAHLRVLAKAGEIPLELSRRALEADPSLRRRAQRPDRIDFRERKAANAIRNRLLRVLGLPRVYDLDRLDLDVGTTLDGVAERAVIRKLRLLSDTAYVRSTGLKGFRLLEKGDPAKVLYSFTLFESRDGVNALRVQADNLDQPLNLNEQMKLDLGSTAKMRTFVNYLEVVAELHRRLQGRSRKALDSAAAAAGDPLTRWTAAALKADTAMGLEPLLEAALKRPYSASPRESFFTGGGKHTFGNFDPADDTKTYSVADALKKSVNLPFVRIMRDIVRYHAAQNLPEGEANDSLHAARRKSSLQKFALREGEAFLARYWKKYRNLSADSAAALYFQGFVRSPRRAAAAWKALHPDSSGASFEAYYRNLFPLDSATTPVGIASLVDRLTTQSWTLEDFGYASRTHPLELWLLRHRLEGSESTWEAVRRDGAAQMEETYAWLFRTRHKQAQDVRIRTILEIEAFASIHRAWQRLGYPFPSLVPSLASALGSSADRPAALAELVGLLLNDGIRKPTRVVRDLHFARGTPYETRFEAHAAAGDTLLPPELCRVALRALRNVVDSGTAARGRQAFPDGKGGFLALGGKTGTGDGRFETYGSGGQLLESRVVSRSATFAFFLGDRFFGTLTAFVQGPEAASFGFTSSLPVQILKMLEPELRDLVQAPSPVEIALPAPATIPAPEVAPDVEPKFAVNDSTSAALPVATKAPPGDSVSAKLPSADSLSVNPPATDSRAVDSASADPTSADSTHTLPASSETGIFKPW